MAEFTPVKLTHKDGRKVTATNRREVVEAKFNGFVEKAPKAAAKKAAAPRAARSTTVKPTEAAKGGPAAKATASAPAKTAAATQTPTA